MKAAGQDRRGERGVQYASWWLAMTAGGAIPPGLYQARFSAPQQRALRAAAF